MTITGKTKIIRGARHGRIKPGRDAVERRHTQKKDGYPVPARHFSRDEIAHYFEGDTIVCLICGFSYVSLPMHLRRIHGMKSDEYRSRYGLPYGRGLCSDDSRRRRSEMLTSNPERIEHMKALGREYGRHNYSTNQRKPPYAVKEATSRISSIPHAGYAWAPETVLDGIKNGLSLSEALANANVGQTAWFSRLRTDRCLKQALISILDAAPIETQIKHGRLGPSFTAEVNKLLDSGESVTSLSKRFGVTQKTIRNHRRRGA